MSAGYLALEWRTGETFRRELTWVSGGVPVNTTGATALLQVRRTAADDAVLLELSTANGRIIVGGTPNIVLHVNATATAGLEWPEAEPAVYDLFVYQGTTATCLLAGPAILRRAVSRVAPGLLLEVVA